jgi:hypothetical protein
MGRILLIFDPMKAIHFFYLGAGIDILALLVAVFFYIKDMFSRYGGTNNPILFFLILAGACLIGGAFWMKAAGKLGLANLLVWIPGVPLAAYGLIILLFIILKPDMR